ncbi:unnamed protein product [Ambrosiozyma monospora]|uniref:Unnamed protein product n=1 Tax=Ambrosiozyma monospora TaxID=43982 RepID=A0ACB5T6F8_AMBMO|nr:unnamed protein product [Ambrosiozyma monospora]
MFTNLLKSCDLDLLRIDGGILIEEVGYQMKFIETLKKMKPRRYIVDDWDPTLKGNWSTALLGQLTCFHEKTLIFISENIHLFKRLTHVKVKCGTFDGEWDFTKIRSLLQCTRIKKVKIYGSERDGLTIKEDSGKLMKKFESKIELYLPFVINMPTTYFPYIQTGCALFTHLPNGNFLSGLKIQRVFLNVSMENSRPKNDNILTLKLGGSSYKGTKLTGLSNLQELVFCSIKPSIDGYMPSFTTNKRNTISLNYDILNTLPFNSLIALDITVVKLLPNSEEQTDSMKLDDEDDDNDNVTDVPTQQLLALPDSLKYLHCSVNQLVLLNTTKRLQNLEFLTLSISENIDETHPCWDKLPRNLRHLKLTGEIPIEKMDFTKPPSGVYRPPQLLGSMRVPSTLKCDVLTIRFEKLLAVANGTLDDDYKLQYIFVNINDIGKRANWTTKAVVNRKMKDCLCLYFKVLLDSKCDETQQQLHVFGDQLTLISKLKEEFPCEGYERARVFGTSFAGYEGLEEASEMSWIDYQHD